MTRLDDLRKAGASALLALAMAVAGAAAVWASTRFAGDVRQAHERALAARTEAQRALAGARAEEAEIAAKIVLCHCESTAQIRIGIQHGIALFQGSHLASFLDNPAEIESLLGRAAAEATPQAVKTGQLPEN